MSTGTTATTPFESALARLHRRAWARAGLRALASGLLAAGLLAVFISPDQALTVLPVAGALSALLALLIIRLRGPEWRLDTDRFAAHLDRRFPEFEESSALLATGPDGLSTVAQLQRARIEPEWPRVAQEPARWLPPLGPGRPLALALLGITLLLAAPWLRDIAAPALRERAGDAGLAGITNDDVRAPRLLGIEVTPPAYTGLEPWTGDQFDLAVPEGAELTWRLAWDGEAALRLVLSDGTGEDRSLVFEPDVGGDRVASAVIRRTALYRIERIGPEGAEALPGVHTLAVTLDRPPRLRIETPNTTALEVPLEGPARVPYTVLMEDDYGLGPVEIRASVASGSGEGVKFRDEVFAFESTEPLDGGTLGHREWDLSALGMSPGDEVYFFTVARDTRLPEPNEARSETVVVRWLDEEAPPELAEGLAIDVMPEYFRSQRQIIIETEQLIADRDGLDAETLDERSRELGQAQGDLKDRYGQYLGDEANEGGNPFPVAERADSDDGDDDDHEDHDEHDDHADDHDHAGESGPSLPDTSGGAAELIARFGHDHGTTDIGPITRRNPVGLMKRAVAAMWQAELHLRLSEPELALPFEVEALEHLNLARQADRIYTRRLGFEPPPVTEERRLTGELDEVESRTRRTQATPDPDPDALARALFALLSEAGPETPLGEDETDLLRRAARHFTALSQQRPTLIRQAATLERLALGGRLALPDCADCLADLRKATWSLLPPVETGPDTGRRPQPDALGAAWLEHIANPSDGSGSP